jgi:hypothetical protein
MCDEYSMSVDERYKYLCRKSEQYHLASRREKSEILDEAVSVTELGRKYLCHLLNGAPPQRKERQRQRGLRYGYRVADAVRVVAESLDWICAERLQPVLAQTAQHLASFHELDVDESLLEKLRIISVSTLHRMLQSIRKDEPRLPQRRGRPSSPMKAQVPMTRIPWDLDQPGHFEVDLVHHCGESTGGDYMCTMQWIDVATGWSERIAVLGRSAREMIPAFQAVLARCPFPVLELHPDNGSEFFNGHLLRFFRTQVTGLKLSRSRPFHKNDNRFVEQKNATLVRAYLGNARLDTRTQCRALNDIYGAMWVYYNLFQPVLHQQGCLYEQDDQGRLHVHRMQDTAQTPLDRLLARADLPSQTRDSLLALYNQTNPRALRRQIRQQLDQLLGTTS